MKTLFVSDLDGTLLRSDETLSQFTIETINHLTAKGMLFSYATARSLVTAKKATKGLNARIPMIVNNGAFIVDNATDEILIGNYFDQGVEALFHDLFKEGVYPIVYSHRNGVEKLSYIPDTCTEGMNAFLERKKGDERVSKVTTPEDLTSGKCFCMICIDEPAKLKLFYEKYRNSYHMVYAKDIYTQYQWLEVYPQAATKANAVLQLKEKLGCDRIISFGDNANDINMFEISDEAYAVENAIEELKSIATGVIGSNDDDGVAKWLNANSGVI